MIVCGIALTIALFCIAKQPGVWHGWANAVMPCLHQGCRQMHTYCIDANGD